MTIEQQDDNSTRRMGRTQRILMITLWATLVLIMICVIARNALQTTATSAEQPPIVTINPTTHASLPKLFPAPPFSLTDQDGKTVTDKDLRGHVWVVDFVFTHCGGPCPMMTTRLAEVQKRVTDPSVKLVSVTVDPERDTPAVLKEYAARFHADESRWSFLTGPMPAIYDLVAGMKLTAKPADADNPILHDERFLLVDQQGQVRGIYHSKDAESMDKLVTDATALAGTSEGGAHP